MDGAVGVGVVVGDGDVGVEAAAELLEQGGPTVDVEHAPEGGGDDVDEEAFAHGDFEAGGVVDGEVVLAVDVVAVAREGGGGLVPFLRVVLVEGCEEGFAAAVAAGGDPFGEDVEAQEGKVGVEIPGGVSFGFWKMGF